MVTSPELPIGLATDPGTAAHRSTPRIRIGSMLLDPDTLELTDGARVEVLRPLPAALLFHLLRERHRIVSKEELHRVLWPDTSVSDAALASAVRDLRRLLGDDGEAQGMVRTFRGRGYRLVASVRVDERDDSIRASLERPHGARDPDHAFVGRDRELARFDRIRLAAESGRGGTLLIESVDGGGRSALLEQLARRTTGVLWLGVRCSDEAWVPRLDTITRILLELESAVGSEVVEAWVRTDPGIGHLLPDFLPRPVITDPPVELLVASLRRIIERASRLAPVVIAIDDLHLVDRASLELLCTGVARTVLLVGTVDPGRTSPAVRSGVDALFSEATRMRLGGLTAADISVLAREWPASQRDSKWAARLRERTGGHPADVLAVLGELAGTGPDRESGMPLLPRAVFDRVARRLASLSRPARAIVAAVAALPPGAPLSLVDRLVDCTSAPGEPCEELDECVRSGLVVLRTHPSGVEPASQLVRHVTLALLSPERRRALEGYATGVLRAGV